MKPCHRWLAWCLYGYAAAVPVSIAVSEPLGFAVFGLWAWLAVRRELPPPWRMPLFWPAAAFALAAAVTVFTGLRPEATLRKLHRFLLLGAMFALPALCEADGRSLRHALRAAAAFLAGATVQAAYDVVRVPLQAAFLPEGGVRPMTLYDLGNMRDPQMFSAALLMALSILLAGPAPGWRPRALWAAVALNAAGLVLHFKRGSWIAFLAASLIPALATGRRRPIAAVAAAACLVLLLPPVQARLGQLREEFSVRPGGRYALWTRVAPELIRAHPLGMGWKAPRHEDFTGHGVPVQEKLNHLHNNALQVALETGWPGLAAWAAWMIGALAMMASAARRAAGGPQGARGIAVGSLAAFAGLMLNGVVEYNFGDGEVFMLLCLLMGLGGAAWSLRARQP